ncbi:MAG TPA: ISAs1 family transposase [Oligoflexus sp.]|uniref:ISAs1 family transposase n=1 Tax=Oligoflexus sp. TaxID=1971216 RepID=UPI002D4021F5|nr:ISAs1 family transposase [Oligoflexus sp.]HYX35153.1 ISAs1 family transposase [Oligoflexus sp.]
MSVISGELHLLDSIDIRGKIVTVDALHSTKDFAAWLKGKEADYVFTMKGNGKKLIDRLEMLNIKENSHSMASTEDHGHGRVDKRTLYLRKELPFWLNFPTAEQAFIIERESIIKKSGKVRREHVYGLTSLKDADARVLLQLNRGHWTIENKMFYVRDVTFNEDRIGVRSGSLPHLMITLRNVIMGIFRKKRPVSDRKNHPLLLLWQRHRSGIPLLKNVGQENKRFAQGSAVSQGTAAAMK